MELVPSINDFEDAPEERDERFVVDNDEKASWAMRRLKSIRDKQAENQAIHDGELARLANWLEKVNTDLQRDAEYFEAILRPYALQERSKDRKSIILPHGTIKTVQGRQKVEIQDEKAFLEWAKANNPELIRVKEEIDKKALNALPVQDGVVISTQGEIIPNVAVSEPEVSVSFVTE